MTLRSIATFATAGLAGAAAALAFTGPGNSTSPVQACVNNSTNLVRVISAGTCYRAESQIFLNTANSSPRSSIAVGTGNREDGKIAIPMDVPAGTWVIELSVDHSNVHTGECKTVDISNGFTYASFRQSYDRDDLTVLISVNPGGARLTARCVSNTDYSILMHATPTT
jgi:hypothetical protein